MGRFERPGLVGPGKSGAQPKRRPNRYGNSSVPLASQQGSVRYLDSHPQGTLSLGCAPRNEACRPRRGRAPAIAAMSGPGTCLGSAASSSPLVQSSSQSGSSAAMRAESTFRYTCIVYSASGPFPLDLMGVPPSNGGLPNWVTRKTGFSTHTSIEPGPLSSCLVLLVV